MTESHIYPCRVYTPDMKLKKEYSKDEAEEHFWRDVIPKKTKPKKEPKRFKHVCAECKKRFLSKSEKSIICKNRECYRKREYRRRYGKERP